jgi:hypothetical protein
MTASTTYRRRHVRGALAVALATLMMLPGVVAAHHAEVTATINCAGLVSFTATAWAGTTAASRTNDDIGVWVAKDGGAFLLLEDDSYFFAASNGFTFSDTYAAGAATTVIVKVQALDNWGNNAAPGDPRQATATKSQNCVEPTPTPTPTDTPTDPTPTPTPTDTPTDPTPTPTEVTPPTDTPEEPTGEVEGQTGTPQTTLPPTATIDGSNDGGAGSALPIILIALLGIAVTIGLLSPKSNRAPRRIRRE